MKSEPLHRNIVRSALNRAWQHKHTWLFGFFAAILGFGGTIELLLSGYAQSLGELIMSLDPDFIATPMFSGIQQFFTDSPYPIIAIILTGILGAIFSICFLWIAGTSVAALITTAREIDHGRDAHLNDGIRAGSRKAFPVVILSILAKLSVTAVSFVIFSLFRQSLIHNDALEISIYSLAFVVMSAVALYILFILNYSTLFLVLRRQRFFEALGAAKRLMHKYWLLTLETSGVIFFTTFFLGLLGLAITLIALLPVLFLFILAAASSSQGLTLLMIAVTALIIIFGIIISASFIASFQAMAWTIMFERATEGYAVAKFHRLERWIASKLPKKTETL
jgi:hypothetical protein